MLTTRTFTILYDKCPCKYLLVHAPEQYALKAKYPLTQTSNVEFILSYFTSLRNPQKTAFVDRLPYSILVNKWFSPQGSQLFSLTSLSESCLLLQTGDFYKLLNMQA